MGRRIRQRREELGLSREELATRGDVTAQMVEDVEEGRVNVPYWALVRAAKALDTTESYFWKGLEASEIYDHLMAFSWVAEILAMVMAMPSRKRQMIHDMIAAVAREPRREGAEMARLRLLAEEGQIGDTTGFIRTVFPSLADLEQACAEVGGPKWAECTQVEGRYSVKKVCQPE